MGDLYGAAVVARLRSIAAAPRLLALRCAGDLLLVAAEAMATVILAARFGSIAGWSGAEAAMLISLTRAGEGLALVGGRGIDPLTFADKVRTGQVDQILTRPVRPLVWLAATEIEPRFASRTVGGLAVTAWAAARAGVAPTPANVLLLAGAAVAAATFFYATLLMGAALTFRTIEGSDLANLLANGGFGVVSMPLEVYTNPLRFVFTLVVPIGLCIYVPVLVVLGRDGPGFLGPGLIAALPFVLAAYLGVAGVAWRAGLRHYESTGS